MPISSISWQHLRLDVAEGSAAVTLRDSSDGRRIGLLAVSLEAPWCPAGAECLDDEIEWRWSRPDGARALARITCGAGLVLRTAITAPGGEGLESSPPLISWKGADLVRAWLGGSQALVVLDERARDGQVLAAVLTSGFAIAPSSGPQPTDHELAIATGPEPVRLEPAHSASTTWTLRTAPHLNSTMGLLPSWMPPTITPAAGAPVRFELPDAVLVTDVTTGTDEHGTQVTAESGHHEVALRGPGLDCRLTLTWNAGNRPLLTGRALRLLRTTDPRTCDAAQAAVIDRAAGEGLVPHDEAADHLETYCQELLDRGPGSLDPLAIPVLVHWSAHSPRLLGAVLSMLGGLHPGPGAMLGWLAAGIAARSAALPVTAPPPLDADDPLCLALHDVLVGAERPGDAVWRTTAWLHGPLPQLRPATGRLRAALACDVLSLSPPGWHLEERLGTGVHEEIEHTRAWLASDPLSDAELAWLVWS